MKRTLPHLLIGINAAIGIVVFFIATAISASEQKSSFHLELKIKETDISITVYPPLNTSSNDLILWLPSEHGLPQSIFTTANSLSQQFSNNEVWVVDLLSSLFLPNQASSINKIENAILYNLIKKVYAKTNKRIFIVSSGKGALLAMRASHLWLQDSINATQLGGLVLLYPNLFIKTPEPGSSAEYYPVTHAVNVPIFILQPENSPWRWQLATLQQHLINADAKPYISILPNIRNRFFFREDATTDELQSNLNLANIINNSIFYLKSEKITSYTIPSISLQEHKTESIKQQIKLRKYTKDPTPPALNLATLRNQRNSIEQNKGKVIIVNFWASWCPPCIHEMPSMEKLYQRYSKSDFTILAVNMAEDKNTINDFLKNRVNVSFPILLDHDGKALQDWQVFAFPSSYVIDKKGKIRYALFGSILWDTPEVIDIIDNLINETVSKQ